MMSLLEWDYQLYNSSPRLVIPRFTAVLYFDNLIIYTGLFELIVLDFELVLEWAKVLNLEAE